MEGQICILNPTAKSLVTGTPRSPRPKSLNGITVGMLDNTKPNFSLFLDVVEEHLRKDYMVGEVIRYRKPGRTVPASEEILKDIKKRCDIVIAGLGD